MTAAEFHQRVHRALWEAYRQARTLDGFHIITAESTLAMLLREVGLDHIDRATLTYRGMPLRVEPVADDEIVLRLEVVA